MTVESTKIMASGLKFKPLALDFESSGLRNENQPYMTYVQGSQCLQIGMAVVDPVSLEPIETFSGKMKFIGSHRGVTYGDFPELTWDEEAEKIHGMTIRSLISEPEPKMVAYEAAEFLRRHYDKNERIVIAGHNPDIDRYHLKQLFWFAGVLGDFKFNHRMIDTYTIGLANFDMDNSESLFRWATGQTRTTHDALWDALAVVAVLKKAFTK